MNPWQVFWAPQLHLPFGGNVAQRIEPNVNWFFDSIASAAGDSKIERKAFEVASYGRQLGLITELLLDITKQTPPKTPEGEEALTRIAEIRDKIEALKKQDAYEIPRDVETLIARLKKNHKGSFSLLRGQIERALDAEPQTMPTPDTKRISNVAPQKLAAPNRAKRKG